jgi:hypothetical protein
MEMPGFEDLDINSDGAVTSDEIEAAMQARAAAHLLKRTPTATAHCRLKN